jgi:ABC-type multidrug transport system fused ATPase/permease subunit
MLRFIGSLLRPYRRTLVVIFLAMLVETAMSLATPWPLKIILDNVVGDHKLSPRLHQLIGPLIENGSRVHFAVLAAAVFVLIAVIGAIASYIDNYYTESDVQSGTVHIDGHDVREWPKTAPTTSSWSATASTLTSIEPSSTLV